MISVGVDAGVVVLLQLKTSGLDGLCWYPAVTCKYKKIFNNKTIFHN
jgi:hypothetical protein